VNELLINLSDCDHGGLVDDMMTGPGSYESPREVTWDGPVPSMKSRVPGMTPRKKFSILYFCSPASPSPLTLILGDSLLRSCCSIMW